MVYYLKMADRTEYTVSILINGRQLNRVIIDQHYRIKHPEMDDPLILKLVSEVSGGFFNIETERDGFQYFRVEPVIVEDKPYRLVLVMYIHDDYLGVVNAFRVQKGQKK